jgi:hypothetical protein
MRSDRAAAVIVALVAFLPFTRGVLAGQTLYFRDLSSIFLPYRRYAVEGLRRGEARFWDPFVHEGVPLVYVPVGYPFDFLQALWLDERWFSLLLVLHVPLAAVTFLALARRLGLSTVAAAAGALVYALAGFALSTVNLYVYVQALAWAPLVVLGLRSAAFGRRRAIVRAAVAIGVALSTLGVELALQAIAIGLVLAFRRRRPWSLGGPLAATVLGLALAAPVILVMRANMGAGERAHGFPVDIVLNQSVHPFTLAQVLVANLYGDLARLPDAWWGSNFFDRGFPYILSLYLGATVLALAVTGALSDRRRSPRLVFVTLFAVLIALGRWGGLESVLQALPDGLRVFRYPTKAWFAVHLGVALLCGVGVNVLRQGRAWRLLLVPLAALGAALAALPLLPRVLPGSSAWFVAHFFPPAMAEPARLANFGALLTDGARGGFLALAAALVALLVLARRASAPLGAALLPALAVADLLRAGAGLNPMMDPAALRPAPEVLAVVRSLDGLQRVFSCPPESSRAYWNARRLRPQRHGALTLSAFADTLTPHFNRPVHVASALGEDLTSLVPLSRLPPRGAGCGNLPVLVPRLRAAGVSHVLSLDPLEGEGLRFAAAVAPPRLAPLAVFVYALTEPVPLRFVASSVRAGAPPEGSVPSPERVWVEGAPEVDGASGSVRALREEPDHLEWAVEASHATALVVLDGAFPGWQARVDGRPVPIQAAGHHRAVWVPAGTSRVTMDYRPRGLRAGVALMALAGTVTAMLHVRGGTLRRDLRARNGARPASAS